MSTKIIYSTTKEEVQGLTISDFFQGWPNPPSVEVLSQSILNSDYVVLAIDEDSRQLVGYITAVSDNVLSAYIPFLEVIPSYQKQGIGHELVNQMLEQLEHLYMVDLVCEPEMVSFYESFGLRSGQAMVRRNYGNQAGPGGLS